MGHVLETLPGKKVVQPDFGPETPLASNQQFIIQAKIICKN